MSLVHGKFTLNRDSSLPIHRQVENWLREQIKSGALPPGSMLPPRKELCDMLGGINHLTVRQAMSSLVREGLLFSVQGRGTFVADEKKKTLRVALVLPNLEDEFTRVIADAVQEYFEQQGVEEGGEPRIRSVIFDSRRDAQKEIDNIVHLEDLPLDGAIILPVSFGVMVEHLARLKADRFPVALLGQVPGIQFNSVTSDDYDGGYKIAEHLLKKGRKRLAWIGNKGGSFSLAPRFEGYRDAISDQGLVYDKSLVCDLQLPTPQSPYEGAVHAAVVELMKRDSRPDAIVCSNDLEAFVCLESLQGLGIKVPQEVSVTGFDGLRHAQHCRPALTTIQTPMRQLGCEAAKLILAAMENPEAPARNVTLPVSLVVRESA